jgi:CheY-like chemotaxis protein
MQRRAEGLTTGGLALAISSANGAQVPTVLVVEDEFLVREDIARHLRDCGCVVLEADGVAEAAAICHAGEAVDVLLTDINLNGGGSGWDVAETFRAARPDIAVVYVSGNGADRSRSVPDSLFFSKPYCAREIVQACRVLAQPPH